MKTFKQYIAETNSADASITAARTFLEEWGYESADYNIVGVENGVPVIEIKTSFVSKYAGFKSVRGLIKFPFKMQSVAGGLDLFGVANLESLAELPKKCPWGFALNGPLAITTLEGGPEHVAKTMSLGNMPHLTSLKGCPQPYDSPIERITITNLDGVTDLEGIADCEILHISGSRVKMSLANVEQYCPSLVQLILENSEITDSVMGLFSIPSFSNIRSLTAHDWVSIVNSHLQRGRDVFACQEELIEAGFDKLAEM